MKKLMILAAVAAVASCARAASYTWAAMTPLFTPGSTTDFLPSGTSAYLFDATQTSQADLLGLVLASQKEWKNWAISGTEAKTTGEIVSIGDTFFGREQTAGTKWQAYFALVYSDETACHLYVSELVDATAFATGAMTITFQQSDTYSKILRDADKGFSDPGWYAIPEPTSGLLLLLGIAGLALKRRRAA